LDFIHFMRCLHMSPWKFLLPEEMRSVAHFALKEHTVRDDLFPATAGAKVLEAAATIFEAEDIDQNGMIDKTELMAVVRKLSAKLEKPFSHDEEDKLLEEAMAKYGNAEGVIDFDHFVGMIASKPWRAMLPKEALDEVSMKGRELAADAPFKTVQPKSPSKTSYGTPITPQKKNRIDVTTHSEMPLDDMKSKLLQLQAMMSRLKVVHMQPNSATVSWPHNWATKPTYVVSMNQGGASAMSPIAMIPPSEYLNPTSSFYPEVASGTIQYTVLNLFPNVDYKVQITTTKGTWRTPAITASTKVATEEPRMRIPEVHRSPVKSRD